MSQVEVEEVKANLREFIANDKFKVYGHLQPAVENSTEEDKKLINDEMNLCGSEILANLEQGVIKADEIHSIVKKSIERLENALSDTEDREFCYELYFKIGEMTGIDLDDYAEVIQQHMMGSLQRMLKNAGINLDDFLKNDPS